jgi:hypothetical protein
MRHRFRKAAALFASLLFTLTFGAGVGAAAAPHEYQVKAVYLFNFGQFVEWPKGAYDTPQAPFVICILGDDPFGKTIDDVVRGESIGPHSLVVRRFKEPQETGDCKILFIGRSESRRLDDALAAVHGQNVLTVTDIEGAEKQGAIIVLFNDNNRIRMRINLAAAKSQQLVISSKLLRPAEVVGSEGT